MRKQDNRNRFILVGATIAIVVAVVFMWFTDMNISNKWLKILIIIFSHFSLGIGIFSLCYYFSFRWLPNLVIAAAWTVIVIILLTDMRNYCISERIKDINELIKNLELNLQELYTQSSSTGVTRETTLLASFMKTGVITLQEEAKALSLVKVPTFVTLLKDAYYSSQIGSSFIKTFLEIYGIGVFGTVFISMATEATKGLWSDEIRSVENKTLLAKFKRARRQRLLARKFFFSKILVSVVYIHIFYYLIAFLCTLVATIVFSANDVTIIRINIILLLLSVTLEAIGATTHFIVTDQNLATSEIKYLSQKKRLINRELGMPAQPNTSSYTCKGVRFSREVSNYLQVLVHSYCNHSSGETASKLAFYPNASGCCKLQVAKNLIARFYRTKEIFISPNNEPYYATASSHFEPDFALDIIQFLFSRNNSSQEDTSGKASEEDAGEVLEETLLTSALSLLDIAQKSMFANQEDEWKDWLFPSNINYEQMMSQIMLDCIRSRFADPNDKDSPCFGDFCKDNHEVEAGVFLLEFPFIVKHALLSRISDKSFAISTRAKNLDEFFRERTEQYYYNLFCQKINHCNSKVCDQIGQYFAQALLARYEKSAFDLQRILPITSTDLQPAHNKPDFSLRLSWLDWCNLSLLDRRVIKKTNIPGWQILFNNYVENCKITAKKNSQTEICVLHQEIAGIQHRIVISMDMEADIKRIVAYDCRCIQDQTYFPHNGFCVDTLEQCMILSSILFEKV